MAHLIVPAGTAHRCRGCGHFYAPSELVFGQEIRDRFGDSADAMTHLWYHLPCAAQLRPNILRAALARYPGPLPERQLVHEILEKQAVAPMLASQGKELEGVVHRTLAAALSRFDPDSWPPRIHLGGEPPSLSSRRHPQSLWIPAGAPRVAVWCARQVANLGGVAPEDSEKLTLLERCLAEPDDPRLHPKPKQGLHHNPFGQALSKVTPNAAAAVSFSALEALARFEGERTSPLRRLIGLAAIQCVGVVSPAKFIPDATDCAIEAAVLIAARDPQQISTFLAGLDAQLMSQEAQASFDERAPTHHTVSRVFWRSAGRLLVGFEDGGFGLLVKLKARWRFIEGGRDDVLASVPDEQFADAAAGVFGDSVDESVG